MGHHCLTQDNDISVSASICSVMASARKDKNDALTPHGVGSASQVSDEDGSMQTVQLQLLLRPSVRLKSSNMKLASFD